MNDIVKIKDVVARYGVSARTLRYYENMGLLQSTRSDEYSYRMYDGNAVKRIEQILTLRKLGISIRDIKRIFTASGSSVVLEVLAKKLEDIDEEVALLSELKNIISSFICHIKQVDFNNESDVRMLYDKAREVEIRLASSDYAGNPAPVNRLFEVASALEEKAVSRLLIPDNVLKRVLQNVYFIWGSNDGIAVADELGRRCGVYVYHTCDQRSKHAAHSDVHYQPDLYYSEQNVLDFWVQDPEEAMQREGAIVRDFTPMVIMDLVQLSAQHEYIICENDIDIESITQFITHAVRLTSPQEAKLFHDAYVSEISCRALSEDAKEELIRAIPSAYSRVKGVTPREMVHQGIVQMVWNEDTTVELMAEAIAEVFGLSYSRGL